MITSHSESIERYCQREIVPLVAALEKKRQAGAEARALRRQRYQSVMWLLAIFVALWFVSPTMQQLYHRGWSYIEPFNHHYTAWLSQHSATLQGWLPKQIIHPIPFPLIMLALMGFAWYRKESSAPLAREPEICRLFKILASFYAPFTDREPFSEKEDLRRTLVLPQHARLTPLCHLEGMVAKHFVSLSELRMEQNSAFGSAASPRDALLSHALLATIHLPHPPLADAEGRALFVENYADRPAFSLEALGALPHHHSLYPLAQCSFPHLFSAAQADIGHQLLSAAALEQIALLAQRKRHPKAPNAQSPLDYEGAHHLQIGWSSQSIHVMMPLENGLFTLLPKEGEGEAALLYEQQLVAPMLALIEALIEPVPARVDSPKALHSASPEAKAPRAKSPKATKPAKAKPMRKAGAPS